jgi:DNA-binding HxlR family transcriptional regulator
MLESMASFSMEMKRLYGDLRAIQEILSAISDDKSLAILRVIAEQDTSGVETHIISRDLQLSPKKYYRRLADLMRNGLVIRKDGSRKYILSSLGKVVYSNLLSIQYIVDNIWRFKAIDAIEVCDDEIYKDVGKISNGLVDTLVHEEHIKAILKGILIKS